MTDRIDPQAQSARVDWHSDALDGSLQLDGTFRITQNVRRFLKAECGYDLVFGRALHAEIRDNRPATLQALVDMIRTRR
ncbi:MAG: DUF6434 domain-containing protein [Pseudomonadota bacterium]